MFGIEGLKQNIKLSQTKVQCPVKGCLFQVERQRYRFKAEERFKCPKHNIYISPSTFEYEDYRDNLLWKDGPDEALLDRIFIAKRESRMARDNSEDAVTWNVFRYLEKNDLTEGFLSQVTGTRQENAEVIYWSYSQKEEQAWTLLNKAREEFGEKLKRSSEPDIIIKTDKALFFIEAKLTSGNETIPSDKESSKKYETGGNNWFKEAFTSDYKTIAISEKKYELMHFWLLGTWMAEQIGLEFFLINLVPEGREEDIETLFKRYIKESAQRRFIRYSWESICQYIISDQNAVRGKDIMIRFFKNKTLGYRNGALQKAFLINLRRKIIC